MPPDATPDATAVRVDELRRQRDQFEASVADLRERLDQAEAHLTAAELAQAELHRLLALALQRPALPAPRDTPADPSGGPTEASSRPWWAALLWWRRGL